MMMISNLVYLDPEYQTYRLGYRRPRFGGITWITPSRWSSWAGSWVLLRIKRR